MDRITEELVDFSCSFVAAGLSAAVKDAAVRHLVDTVACAIAGSAIDAAQIASRVARSAARDDGATLIADGTRVTPDMAAFANGTMVRAWDWNDGMYAKAGGHPSDMVAALLAVGETAGSSPEELLVAMALAYEILGALGDATTVKFQGFDQGTFMGPAGALAMGKLLGLNNEQLANAVGLAVAPSIPLSAGRRARSMWKCSATAASLRWAVFAVTLAKAGMVGPDAPFTGPGGIWDKVTGPFEVNLPAKPGGPRIIETSYMKRYPADMHTLAVVGLAPVIRSWASEPQIASIDVETYHEAWFNLTTHASVYDPKSREQADHSLAYVFAVALVDGGINRDSYTPERVLDPALRPVMAKIKFHENHEFSKEYRSRGAGTIGLPRWRVTVRTHSGEERVDEVTYHRGHSLNPMTVGDINEKLDEACAGIVTDDRKEEIRTAWWNIDKANTIAEPLGTLARFR